MLPVEVEDDCPRGAVMEDGVCVVPGTTNGSAPDGDDVLGVELSRPGAEAPAANRAPAVLGPVAGILPNTGAGDYALMLLGGAGLLTAGAALLARKRRIQGSR